MLLASLLVVDVTHLGRRQEINYGCMTTNRCIIRGQSDVQIHTIFILYNVPGRDCGQHSKGGLKSGDEYRHWIRKVAEGAGQEKVVFVLEPDALGLLDKCLSKEQQDERLAIIWDAVKVLRHMITTRKPAQTPAPQPESVAEKHPV